MRKLIRIYIININPIAQIKVMPINYPIQLDTMGWFKLQLIISPKMGDKTIFHGI